MTMKEKIIFKTIVGSQCYGLATETSDIDYKSLYIADDNELFGLRELYRDHLIINKDDKMYEIGRFLELLGNGNPDALEMLFVDKQFVQIDSPQMELIRQHKNKFITKRAAKAFMHYGLEQIKKAKGKDKFVNWEKERFQRKEIIEFCYVAVDGKSVPFLKYIKDRNLKQENFGLVKLNHFREAFGLYYGINKGYKGISFEKSNDVRLSSIPKGENMLAVFGFQKDMYGIHCRDYRNYQEFLKKHNKNRFVETTKAGQKIDGKNCSHLRRLVDIGLEISKGQGINLIRPNRDYLLGIKRGEYDLQTIIKDAQTEVKNILQNVKTINLPDDIDKKFLNDLLIQIRKM